MICQNKIHIINHTGSYPEEDKMSLTAHSRFTDIPYDYALTAEPKNDMECPTPWPIYGRYMIPPHYAFYNGSVPNEKDHVA